MKIGIIGAGASGLYSALLIASKHPDWSITIFDKENKAGRKILATGNGHCNLLPSVLKSENFNNEDWVSAYINRYPLESLLSALDSFSIFTKTVGEGIYPLTYSAKSYLELLLDELEKRGVKINLSERVLDYKNGNGSICVITDADSYDFDALLICVGGKSSPNLGSDGSFFEILSRHGYCLRKPLPGLSPLIVKESRFVKPLSGLRHECKATVYKNGNYLAEEKGEVLFKDNGLSGICIFNLHSRILREREKGEFTISLDLFDGLDLTKKLQKSFSFLENGFLDPFIQKPLQKEVLRQFGRSVVKKNDIPLLEKKLHSLAYRYEGSYPFANSQVTIGGIAVNEVDDSLQSKREKRVYLLGEVLDVDGLCGGNNLAWALLSAITVSESL